MLAPSHRRAAQQAQVSLTAPDKENLRQNLLPRTPSPRLLEGPFSPRRARDVKLLR